VTSGQRVAWFACLTGWGSDIEGRKTNMQSEVALDKDWIGRDGGREEVLV
jgi:hypothetical protein